MIWKNINIIFQLYCPMVVVEISSESEFKALLKSKSYSLTVVMFTRNGCEPCRMIAPYYDHLSNKYKRVQFLKVNTDDHLPISTAANVYGLPCFTYYKRGSIVYQFVGANKAKLINSLKCYAK